MARPRIMMRTTMFDFNDSRTLLEIYQQGGINPEEEAIFMALDGTHRIPISRKYDLVPFKDALKEIAKILRDQNPQEIYIGNVLDGKGYEKNSVHHFEIRSRDSAKKMEETYKLNNADELALIASKPNPELPISQALQSFGIRAAMEATNKDLTSNNDSSNSNKNLNKQY